MNAQIRTLRRVLPLALCALALGACSTADDTADTASAAAQATGSAMAEGGTRIAVTLTFEGETCTYDGPSEAAAGTVELTFVNNTEGYGTAELFGLDEGYSHEDAVAALAERTDGGWPSWMREIGAYDLTPAGETNVWTKDLDPGAYAAFCVDTSPKEAFAAGGLTLTE